MDTNLFEQFPDCIISRKKLKGILLDYFPEERVKVNLILNAFDEGIIDEIKTCSELNQIMFGRWKKIIIDNYGVSEENAEWTIEYWFKNYGHVCEKRYPAFENVEEVFIEENLPPLQETTPEQKLYEEQLIDVAKMAIGHKLPKEIIEIHTDVDHNVDISSFKCAIRKDYEYGATTGFKYTGEYSGISHSNLLVFVMVYNARNELIGYDHSVPISDDFKGKRTFSETFYIPGDEFISKIIIKIAPNPVIW